MRSASAQTQKPALPQEFFEAWFSQTLEPVLVLDAHDCVLNCNEAFESRFGFELAVGKKIDFLIPKLGGQGRQKPLNEKLIEFEGTFEDVAVRSKDGKVKTMDVHIRFVKEGSETWKVLAFRDLSEKKELEQEILRKHIELKQAYESVERANLEIKATQETLVQAGKLAALGELSAGIGHELNQPLTAIKGYAQELVVLLEKTSDKTIQSYAGEIVKGADKMAKIIHSIRAFIGKTKQEFEVVQVNVVLDEALRMLEQQFLLKGVAVHRKFDPKLGQAYVNAIQIEQVVINLLANARDAVLEKNTAGGNIWVETRGLKEFVEIDIKDDGAGMSDDVKSKIFNPFFTTKEVGKGMGLGLSLSFGIIQKVHGALTVESKPGQGSVFKLKIPRDFRKTFQTEENVK